MVVILPIFIEGKRMIENTKIPIPPNHCVNERQKSMVLERDSTFVRIEAPVVENPDADSKNASIGFAISPEMINGIAPMIETSIHQHAAVRTPSLTLNFNEGGRNKSTKTAPATRVNAIVIAKAISALFSAHIAATINAGIIATPINTSNMPMT